jgi:diacylglycerol kinase family enzyme
MDMGRIGEHYFLEAAGVGLDAGLFGYFERLESGANWLGVVRATVRFLRRMGSPRVRVEFQGQRIEARAPLITVANGPYVGAAYTVAPEARIDDGLLDVVIFRDISIPRVLVHLAFVAGGRPLPPPRQAATLKVPWVRVSTVRRRPLPVHADGDPIGATPTEFTVAPGALRVIVGPPDESGIRAWEVVGPVDS